MFKQICQIDMFPIQLPSFCEQAMYYSTENSVQK